MKSSGSWSISRRLIWRFTFTAAGVLCGGLWFVYLTVVQHADSDDQGFLRDRLIVIRADIGEEFPNPQWLQKEIESFRDVTNPGRYQLRILDANGRTLAESVSMSDKLQSSLFSMPGESVEAGPKAVDYRARDGGWYFLMSAWIGPADAAGNRWLVELSMDRSDEKAFRRRFRMVLLAVFLAGAGGAAAISRWVVQRGLAPVIQMEETMARVGATQLSERVGERGWPIELQGFATAFDEMLGRLEESFGRLSRFSADIAHDLRTPLFNMRGETEVALSKSRTVGEYQDVLESSLEELSRLTQMIDSLLFLARAENPERRIDRVAFDGRAEITELVDLHSAIAAEQKITIEVLGSATIFADLMLFRRAISNLLANARQYTEPGGSIRLHLKQLADNGAEVSVADSGVGIAPEHRPRVFDRLYRVDSSRHSQNSGLGLAIVKSIMQLHNGHVELESELQRGTTVRLTFSPPG